MQVYEKIVFYHLHRLRYERLYDYFTTHLVQAALQFYLYLVEKFNLKPGVTLACGLLFSKTPLNHPFIKF